VSSFVVSLRFLDVLNFSTLEFFLFGFTLWFVWKLLRYFGKIVSGVISFDNSIFIYFLHLIARVSTFSFPI